MGHLTALAVKSALKADRWDYALDLTYQNREYVASDSQVHQAKFAWSAEKREAGQLKNDQVAASCSKGINWVLRRLSCLAGRYMARENILDVTWG